MPEGVLLIDENQLKEIMKHTDISGLAIAFGSNQENISMRVLGTTDHDYDLHLVPKLPGSLENYKTSYILVGTQLHYIKKDGNLEIVPINDFKKFSKELHVLKGNNKSDIIHLSRSQLNKLITLNGAHKPEDTNTLINSHTTFRAASLSKPVFAYLVLTLIEENKANRDKLGLGKFHLPEGLSHFDLDTPLNKILPELMECKDKARAQTLTARMVLSHQSGILNSQDENDLPTFYSKPGTEYEYNGLPYFYLQLAIDRLTHSSLQQLAQKYVFDPRGMKDTSFLRPISSEVVYGDETKLAKQFPADLSKFPAICANSLSTTASDYMRFILHWINDEKLAHAFESQIPMTKDRWASNMGLSDDVLQRLASGLGWALQKNSQGKVVRAFHWADMNQWRADIAIDLENKTGIVYLANSPNGHILADHIISPNVELADGLNYISGKLGFAIKYEKNWQENQNKRFEKIGTYLRSRENLSVSDYEMIKSQFGRGSNTAKKLQTNQKSTTARLIERGIAQVSPQPSQKTKSTHDLQQHHRSEKKDKEELDTHKKEISKHESVEAPEPSNKLPTPFSTNPKPSGGKNS